MEVGVATSFSILSVLAVAQITKLPQCISDLIQWNSNWQYITTFGAFGKYLWMVDCFFPFLVTMAMKDQLMSSHTQACDSSPTIVAPHFLLSHQSRDTFQVSRCTLTHKYTGVKILEQRCDHKVNKWFIVNRISNIRATQAHFKQSIKCIQRTGSECEYWNVLLYHIFWVYSFCVLLYFTLESFWIYVRPCRSGWLMRVFYYSVQVFDHHVKRMRFWPLIHKVDFDELLNVASTFFRIDQGSRIYECAVTVGNLDVEPEWKTKKIIPETKS